MAKFIKGKKRPINAGRKPGSINKNTRLLKEAILIAAELEGDVALQKFKTAAERYRESEKEAAKRGGLVGYLRYLARSHPQSFATLLGRVLPTQVRVDARTETIFRTLEEVQEEMARRGMPLEAFGPLLIESRALEPEDDDESSAPEKAA
jgi:hypothetical protein